MAFSNFQTKREGQYLGLEGGGFQGDGESSLTCEGKKSSMDGSKGRLSHTQVSNGGFGGGEGGRFSGGRTGSFV